MSVDIPTTRSTTQRGLVPRAFCLLRELRHITIITYHHRHQHCFERSTLAACVACFLYSKKTLPKQLNNLTSPATQSGNAALSCSNISFGQVERLLSRFPPGWLTLVTYSTFTFTSSNIACDCGRALTISQRGLGRFHLIHQNLYHFLRFVLLSQTPWF